ncbi:hypothetical protein N824_00685 [Pedobacter sp. V48]|nr:hypothetical protein N824_00685 [Pedobacter sp. V48]
MMIKYTIYIIYNMPTSYGYTLLKYFFRKVIGNDAENNEDLVWNSFF